MLTHSSQVKACSEQGYCRLLPSQVLVRVNLADTSCLACENGSVQATHLLQAFLRDSPPATGFLNAQKFRCACGERTTARSPKDGQYLHCQRSAKPRLLSKACLCAAFPSKQGLTSIAWLHHACQQHANNRPAARQERASSTPTACQVLLILCQLASPGFTQHSNNFSATRGRRTAGGE